MAGRQKRKENETVSGQTRSVVFILRYMIGI